MPLIKADQLIRDKFEIEIAGAKIEFQFPPKVSTDTRTATWEEIDAASTEEVGIFMGSRERVFQIEWTYMVGAISRTWNIEKVAGECSKTRNYFYGAVADSTTGPIAKVKLASHGDPDTPMTMRLSDLNIKHGTAYVLEDDKAFPLRTDIAMTAKIWTQKDGSGSGSDSGSGSFPQVGRTNPKFLKKTKQQPIKSLEPTPSGLWI